MLLCDRNHPNIWSGSLKRYFQSTAGLAPVPIRQDSPPQNKYRSSKSNPDQPPSSSTSAAGMDWEAKHRKQRRRRGGEGEERGPRAQVRERGCAAQTAALHFDNLITQLQLATGKRREIQCLKEVPFFPNFKGFPAT